MKAIVIALLLLIPAAAQAQQIAPSTEQRNQAQTTRSNAAAAGLPNIQGVVSSANQNDLCLGLQSVGYGTPVLGLTFNFTKRDQSCQRIRTAKELTELGLRGAAIQVMCLDHEVRLAMQRAGTPCDPPQPQPH